MVYYKYLCKYVSEETLARAGCPNLEGSPAGYFEVNGKEACLYHGCFQDDSKTENSTINLVIVGVKRNGDKKIDYYFGSYNDNNEDLMSAEETKKLLDKAKELIKKRNRISLKGLEKRIESLLTPTP